MPHDSSARRDTEHLRRQVLELCSSAEPHAVINALRGLEPRGDEVEDSWSKAQPDDLALDALVHAGLAEALRAVGQPHLAFEHALRAARLAELSDDEEALARATLAIAHICVLIGYASEARRRLLQVAAIPGVAVEHRVRAQMNLASLLRAEGRLTDAAAAFDDLLPIRVRVGSHLGAALLINAASCYQQVGRTDDATLALEEARRILSPSERPDLWTWTDAIAAWVALRQDQCDAAIVLARAALDPARPGSSLEVRSSAARALADAARAGGSAVARAEAIGVLEETLTVAEQGRARGICIDLHTSMAAVAESAGDLVRAVRHLRQARRLEADTRKQEECLRLEWDELKLELVRMQVHADALRDHREELAQANRALMTADAARSRLLSTLAHDLRGPLTNILALIDLAEVEDPDNVRTTMAELGTAVSRMITLLDGAMDPGDHARMEVVDVTQAARETAGSFNALARRKGQTIAVGGDPDVLVRADPVVLGRLIDNLVSNALKYGPPDGTVEVEVTTAGRRVDLVVKDRGPGFPGLDPSEGMLFGHQLSAHATGGEASWGLGLHAVYQQLATLGGILAIGNRDGGGAVVRVTMPRA